jgi:hypothetical protein
MSAVASSPSTVPQGNRDFFDAKHQITASHTSELVIALCGPIGSPLHQVAAAFEKCLIDDFGYESCRVIRLSKIIEKITSSSDNSAFKRATDLIKKGDDVREKYGASILAEFAIK